MFQPNWSPRKTTVNKNTLHILLVTQDRERDIKLFKLNKFFVGNIKNILFILAHAVKLFCILYLSVADTFCIYLFPHTTPASAKTHTQTYTKYIALAWYLFI